MSAWSNLVTLAAWMWLAVTAGIISEYGTNWIVCLFLFVCWVPIGCAAFVCFGFADPDATWNRSRVFRWLSGPAVPILALVLFVTEWPLAARIWLCESALKAHAEQVRCEPQPELDRVSRPAVRVGLFEVQASFRYFNGGVGLQTRGPNGHGGGIIYAPHGLGASKGVRHVYGPWYRWEPDR